MFHPPIQNLAGVDQIIDLEFQTGRFLVVNNACLPVCKHSHMNLRFGPVRNIASVLGRRSASIRLRMLKLTQLFSPEISDILYAKYGIFNFYDQYDTTKHIWTFYRGF